MTSRPIANEGD